MTFTAIRRAAVSLLVGALLTSCRAPRSTPPGSEPMASVDPDQTLGFFTMDSYVQGRREWRLVSPRGELFDREHRVDLIRPEVRFFNENREGSQFSSQRGRLNTENQNFWAGDGVVMISTDGVRLETDWVDYEKAADRFVSTAPVTVSRGRSVVRGVGWEARSDMSDMTIHRQRGEIAPEDTRGLGAR